jgi:nucleoside-diphosphate-sugar epimerase
MAAGIPEGRSGFMGIESAIVTGATGPIGIALVHYLAELGITVTALVHPGSKRIRYLSVSGRSRIVECDLGQMGQLTCMPETDAFFHLGWSATDSRSSRDTPEIQASNILHTLDAVKLAQASGCKMFVGVGSQSELWRAELKPHAAAPALVEESYGIAKYAAGRLSLRSCEMRGIRHCWARIMSIYGPGERPTTALMYCVHSLLHGESPSLTKGEQQWDYLYAADAARALYLIAEKGRHGAVYAVGSGCARPLREYFESARDCIDHRLPLGLGEKEYPVGQIMHVCADIGPLTADTGFVPQYSFEEGIRATIEWARRNPETS